MKRPRKYERFIMKGESARVVGGVMIFVLTGYLAYAGTFALGLIFLPGPELAAVLGFVAGFGGGYVTAARALTAAIVGLLGGILGAIPVGMLEPHNPVPGGIPVWTRVLQGLIFIITGTVGAVAGDGVRKAPPPPPSGWWG